MNTLKEIIAKNIQNLRKQRDMTQAELAERLNYTDKAISKWERGESIPDVGVLKRVADMFGVTVDYLLDENAEKNRPQYERPPQAQNKLIIIGLWVSFVWILATIIFVYVQINLQYTAWIVYIWAIPLSTLIILIFNNKWGRKKYTFWIASVLLWSTLTSVFIQTLEYNTWLIYLVGVPIQIAIIFWANLKK